MSVVISIENLSKIYRLGQIGTGTFSNDLKIWWATKILGKPNPLLKIGESGHIKYENEELWALRDVSFTVSQGEVLGIIGRNGAGKSTLLKILSRVTAPTSGKVKIKGRIASLLEVGTGFHPELTGRENIFLNGAILGMSRAEIERKFDEIVDFSEVEKFIDTPVKRYSSGMYVRLAFSVAAHLDPEILIVDEVLAVGDAVFQKKCLGKMGDAAHQGRTILFVSHNMAAIQKLCKQTALLQDGLLITLASTPKVIENYLAGSVNEPSEFQVTSLETAPGKGGFKLLRVSVKNALQKVSANFQSNSPLSVEIEYELIQKIDNIRVGFRLINQDGIVVLTSVDTDPDGTGTTRLQGRHISRCTIPGNFLNSGKYYITAACDRPMQENLLLQENIISFSIDLIEGIGSSVPDGRYGVIRPSLNWEVDEQRF